MSAKSARHSSRVSVLIMGVLPVAIDAGFARVMSLGQESHIDATGARQAWGTTGFGRRRIWRKPSWRRGNGPVGETECVRSREAPVHAGESMQLACLLALTAIGSAQADVEADKAAIAARLQDFTAAFNARDAAGACEIFAPDLVSTMRGRPDNGREAVCKRIAAALADRSKTMHLRAGH